MLRVLSITSNPEALIAAYARVSRSKKNGTERLKEAIYDKEETRKTIRSILECGHDNILESVNMTIELEGSRLCLRDILLNRLISPIEMSQRYVQIDKNFFHMPKEIKKNNRAEQLFKEDLQLKIEAYYEFYERLKSYFIQKGKDEKVASGLAKEDARYFLSNSTKSRIVVNANLRSWLDILVELEASASEEHSAFSKKLEEVIKENFPTVYKSKIKSNLQKNNTQKNNIEYNLPKLTESEYDFKVKLIDYLIPSTMLKPSIKSKRKDELVIFQYSLAMSQSAVRQYLRHRMQSLIITEENITDYALPASFAETGLEKKARDLFTKINANIKEAFGINPVIARYMLTNAHKVRMLTSLNLRELSKISSLRECLKAQWEIRSIVKEMTKKASQLDPTFKAKFGPRCVQLGFCPEGENSCHEFEAIKKEYML